MSPEPFPGFVSLETHHCITGSMKHIYAYRNHDVSEEMLLGLGAGLGFIYWHMKGAPPMFGGRANVGRPGEDGLEITAGRRTGVLVEKTHTGSATKAEKALIKRLESADSVMLNVDMGFLPYFTDLPDDFHFGGHAIAVGGFDPESRTVLVADRDAPLHSLSLEDLAMARGSKFKPFPPNNIAFTFDFSSMRQPEPEEIKQAIGEVCHTMLEGPISNLGIRGIRKAADQTLKWHQLMDEEELRWASFNTFIFIDATGGTGGGIFRYMYGRFLEESAAITGVEELAGIAEQLKKVGDLWQKVARIYVRASKVTDPVTKLAETTDPLMEIADQEESLWTELRTLV
jgi:hypothetical protein